MFTLTQKKWTSSKSNRRQKIQYEDQRHKSPLFGMLSNYQRENSIYPFNALEIKYVHQSTCCQLCFKRLGTTLPINIVHLAPLKEISVKSNKGSISCQNGCQFHIQCMCYWLTIHRQQTIDVETKNTCPFCKEPLLVFWDKYNRPRLEITEKEMHKISQNNNDFMLENDNLIESPLSTSEKLVSNEDSRYVCI